MQRLTLNLGVRFNAYTHAYYRYNQVANFVPSDYNPAAEFNPDGSLNTRGPGFTTPADYTTPFYMNGIKVAGVDGFHAAWSRTIG